MCVLMQAEPALVPHDLSSVVKREGVRTVRDRAPPNGRRPPRVAQSRPLSCSRILVTFEKLARATSNMSTWYSNSKSLFSLPTQRKHPKGIAEIGSRSAGSFRTRTRGMRADESILRLRVEQTTLHDA